MAGFPEDIITDILLRLPSKSLVRFRCVSKDWNTLITTPSFIKAHLHQPSQLRCHLLLQYRQNKVSKSIVRQDSNRTRYYLPQPESAKVSKLKVRYSGCHEFSNLDPPPAIIADGTINNFKLVDSFNGIVCLYGEYDTTIPFTSTIWLWNPAINDLFALPKPRFPISPSEGSCVGLGFNPLSSHIGDFKVVSISEYYVGKNFMDLSLNVQVYSLRKNSWKVLDDCSLKWRPGSMSNQVILNQFICWCYHYHIGYPNRYTTAILSFDVVNEEFHEMGFPYSDPCHENNYITLLDGCLSLLVRSQLDEGYEVWRMKEFGNTESWSKMYSIDDFSSSPVISRPLGFASTDEAIFSKTLFLYSPTYLLSYDTKRRAISYDYTTEFSVDSFYNSRLTCYVDSLVSVSQISALEGEE